MSLLTALRDFVLPPESRQMLEKLPNATGRFIRDPWGYDKDKSKYVFGLCKRLYDDYFRVVTTGLEKVPTSGRVLIIGNHSGQLPMDGVLVGMSILTNPHGPRLPRAMIERFFPTVPFIGNVLNQVGAVIGDPQNCRQMLENEEAIIVFPEGIRGSGKLYRQRYQLQRFGHGFMHLAMRYNTPIVPVGIVGCEETMPSLANIEPLAKLLHVPYIPVAIPVPLPARVSLNFGEPLHFDDDAVSEQDVAGRVEQVKSAISGLIEKGLAERESVF